MLMDPDWRALSDRVAADYRSRLGDALVSVACFGSAARGEADPESDLDLYVVTRDQAPLWFTWDPGRLLGVRLFPEFQALTARGYRPEPRPIFHSLDQLRGHPWILLDIAIEGVILIDREQILERELEAVRRRLAELGSRRVRNADGSGYWELKPDYRPGEVFSI